MNRLKIILLWAALLTTAANIDGCGGGSSSHNVPVTPPPPPLPLAATIDIQMNSFMSRYGATAASISIMKNGVTLYEQGYGFQDAAKTTPTPPNLLFRTCSIIKPVTVAAIKKLAASGTLSLSDHAFCTGSNAPCWLPSALLPPSTDSRAKDITIQNLIDHKGGWDGWNRGASSNGDPIAIEPLIRDSLGLSRPPTRTEITSYVMGFPLDFAPGTRYSYSNFGYMLLGMIIEQASGMSYTQYIQNTIMTPLGISNEDFKAGKSLPAEHDPREPNYISTWLDAPSAFTKGKLAPFAEEGFNADNWLSVGLSVTTAKAMSAFASAYKIPTGDPLAPGTTNDGGHAGGLDGTATYNKQLRSGISYTVFFNTAVETADYGTIENLLSIDSQLPP